ncbi:YhaN family protein [Asaia krungthepensis]|uniref:YhaN AAA domain-containing protein n=1 Tax=Asaia krungthepensis NRIC 0535 TaxID=1307925 RepID=A0ABQ0PWK3_9PROT|nr:YhaN family protein [Asaia krungthepensis]GBQ83387.1 hypothetical protein AA0535_0236 [Asaia krungthepensis NRIC 0535]
MRLARLDLLRYGGFADRSYIFEAHGSDLHVLYGANEAGKSTTLQAISDLLFGFPHNKAQDWRYDAAQLRIGAVVEQDNNAPLGMIRKRGTKQTLLASDGTTPLDENRLISLLGGVDRTGFERLWSLDHARLRQGGHAMAQFEDDLGQQLLAAGFGLGNVQSVLASLDAEAGALWKKNGRGTRLNDLRNRLNEARTRLIAAEKDSQRWNSLNREAGEIDEALVTLQAGLRDNASERQSLERLRRVRRDLDRHEQILATLRTDMPPRFSVQDHAAFDETIARHVACQHRIDRQTDHHDGLLALRRACHPDALLLAHETTIDSLQARAAHLDPLLATSQEQSKMLEALDLKLRIAGHEGPYGTILAALPDPETLTRLRPLTLENDTLTRREQDNRDAIAHAKDRLAAATSRLDHREPPPLAALLLALQQAEKRDTLDRDLAGLGRDLHQAEQRLARALNDLHPWQGELDNLHRMAIPDPDFVDREMTIWRDRDTQCAVQRTELVAVTEAKARQELSKAHLEQRQIVSFAALFEARAHRDALLDRLDPREENGRALYLDALRHADSLADRRFDEAEESARLTQIEQEIDHLTLKQDQQRQRIAGLDQAREAARKQWQEELTRRTLPCLDPERLRGWLTLREQALEAADAHALIISRQKDAESLRRRAFESLRAALPDMPVFPALGEAVLWAQSRRTAWQREADLASQLRADIDQEQRSLDVELRRKEDLSAERAILSDRWASLGASCPALDLAPTSTIDALTAQHKAATEALALKNRLDIQKAEAESLESEIARFIAQLQRQDGLASRPPRQALDLLANELRQARLDRDRAQSYDADLEKTAASLDEARREQESITRVFADFASRLAGAETPDPVVDPAVIEGLRAAFTREKTYRTLQEEAAAIERRLADEENVPDLAALLTQAQEWSAEAVEKRLDDLALAREAMERERDDKLGRRGEIGTDLRQIEQAHDARDAALAIETCRTEMAAAAEAWASSRIQSLILNHVARRQRDENTNPLLKSAERYFEALTCQRYGRLVIAEDGKSPELAALTRDETLIRPGSMSEGTRDQLFLSLRLAALDQSRARGIRLPFIVDDLFMTFDEARAGAGLATLAGIAAQNQILFFTHHAHLADLAEGFGARRHNV